jgi:hypothetical protein
MLHITAASCETEETAEHMVSMEPCVRNYSAFDWQERLAVLIREEIKLKISCLSEERLQDVGRPNV